jgi:hypothetical protein
MKKYLMSFVAVAAMVTLLFGISHISAAADYTAIVLDDSTHVGIPGVRVDWTFPDSSCVTYTDSLGKSTVPYSGSSGNTTVSISKPGYYPVHPASGTINATTHQYRYPFTMLPN